MDPGLSIPIVAGREGESHPSKDEMLHSNEKAGSINETYVSEEDVEIVVVGEDGDVIRASGIWVFSSAKHGVLFAIEERGLTPMTKSLRQLRRLHSRAV